MNTKRAPTNHPHSSVCGGRGTPSSVCEWRGDALVCVRMAGEHSRLCMWGVTLFGSVDNNYSEI